MRAFTFGGICSRDYGVGISGTGTYDAPERDVSIIDIPGRDGSIVQDNGRFKNINVTYPSFMHRGFDEMFPKFKAAMMQFTGYQKLTDEYDPEHYRMAMFSGPITPQTGIYNKSGKFDVVFNCKPQRFLASGAKERVFLPVTTSSIGAAVEGIAVTPGTSFKVSAIYQSGVTGAANIKYYDSSETLLKTDAATVSGQALSYNGTVPASAATVTVEFDGRVETYLTIINNGVKTCYTDSGLVLVNPTLYDARPIITFYGGQDKTFSILTTSLDMSTTYRTISVAIGDYSTYDHVTIDSNMCDCYFEGYVDYLPVLADMNQYVTITEGLDLAYDYPVIAGGKAIFIPTANADKIVITPGWWEV